MGLPIFPMKNFRNLRIATKFIIWFLCISLVPLATAIYVSYKSSRTVLEEGVKNSLLAVADNKTNQVEAFSQKMKNDVINLSLESEVIDAMGKLTNTFKSQGRGSAEYATLAQVIMPMLSYYQKLSGYNDIVFISSNGDIMFSVMNANEIESVYEAVLNNRKSELSEAFIKAKASQSIEISNFENHTESRESVIFIVAPIFKQANLIGFVACEINSKGVYEFVQDYANLGKTGEAIIVSKIDEKIVFITPLRFNSDAAFKNKINIKSHQGQGIEKALKGTKGSGIFTDYRGQKVLEIWNPLPTFRLCMIVKIDTKEVFAAASGASTGIYCCRFKLAR